jgi:crotonobetainyl-CoA:carnitine CoA-transferase CaiB-like acyl-CoA transferase
MEQSSLANIRVLDLSRVLAGPLCSMLLGDLGANVIKVERPGTGDETRGWGPPFDARGASAYYLAINRNKLGICAELGDHQDRELILRLVDDADVVIDNFLPGALQRFGISVDQSLQRNPRLVWCTISGFGSDSRRPGYDFVVQAEAGWMSVTGAAAGEPMKSGIALADIIAGKDATIAILAALVGRSHPGAIRRLHISLADSARAALVNVAQNALITGEDAKRWGNAHPNLVPYQLFDARDRPLVVAVGSDAQWKACARALGLDVLAEDPDYATNAQRLALRDAVVSAMRAALRTRTAADWLATLQSAGVPCGIVKSVLEAVRDASTASPLAGMPSSVGGAVRLPPPRLGEHDETIRAAGWEAFARLPV